jgi:hypothetical protein
MSLAKHMTRLVLIGKLVKYDYKSEGVQVGKGQLDIGKGQKIQFTIWNRTTGENQHTKAADFAQEFKEGDLVFITGSDNRSYSEDKDRYYEDVQVWDYRAADEDEAFREVFVYVGDVKNLTKSGFDLSFVNYKNQEMLFPIITNSQTQITEPLEEGARVKVKGQIFSGMKMDFFGDSEGYVTERTGVVVETLHSAAELQEDEQGGNDGDSGMWD